MVASELLIDKYRLLQQQLMAANDRVLALERERDEAVETLQMERQKYAQNLREMLTDSEMIASSISTMLQAAREESKSQHSQYDNTVQLEASIHGLSAQITSLGGRPNPAFLAPLSSSKHEEPSQSFLGLS